MRRERLLELMERFAGLRVAVMGDLFLDRWLTIDPALNEPSIETGLAAWQVVNNRCCAGAAGTVLNNLSALGVGQLSVISLLGEDGDGFEVKRALAEQRVELSLVVESAQVVTPAYVKPMFLAEEGAPKEGHRMDYKNRASVPAGLTQALLERLEQAAERVDAVIFLDQLTEADTGVIGTGVRERIARLHQEHPGLLLYADSRAFIGGFRNVVIKCNNHEAAALAGLPVDDAFDQARVFRSLDSLRRQTSQPVFVTCNQHGVAVHENGVHKLVPAVRQEGPIDVCGAGDACTAGIVCALCAGASPCEAALVGNLCAGVTVRKLGTTGTCTRAEALALYDEQLGGAEND